MTGKSEILNTDFDPHFKIFHQLMSFKILNILLISSAYDAFIMEEEGSIALQVIKEYQGLNLSGAPLITRVSSVEEALQRIQYKKFDLVITTPFLRGANAFDIGMEVKKIAPTLPVILIAHNLHSIKLPRQAQNYFAIDNIFLWTSGAELLLAVVKNVEDHANVTMDTARAMVRVIIYVEDSPADRSVFLPLIYREIVGQTQAVLDGSLNEKHRLLKMRARPKVLMATNYEEALSLYESYKPFVFSIISDARFPLGDEIDGEAGVKLLSYAREEKNDLPLLLLSTEKENAVKAAAIPAVFVDKHSPTLQDEIHAFFLDYLGFGDFVFRLPDGSEIDRAVTLGEFEKLLGEVPDESLQYHAARNHFSNWIMARAEVDMARHLHKEYLATLDNCMEMRKDLVSKVRVLRKMRQMGVVAKFKPERYDPEVMDFVKIGEGAIGGKARGLAFMWARLQSVQKNYPLLAEMAVTIPRTCVIAADGFQDFIQENNLTYSADDTDADIEERFVRCRLPEWLLQKLKIFTDRCRFPLSVRSSSLLEDGLFRPYAGLYETYFLHNTSSDDTLRLSELEDAVKLIYASTWFDSPQAFARSTGSNRRDAMAVIIQEVVGSQYGDYYYPAVSGVAQSHNYYPIMNMKAEEGIAHIALGLGKTVVEGKKSLRFSPAHPERIVQFSSVEDILENCQRHFYALDVSNTAEFIKKDSNLVVRSVEDAEKEKPVQLLSSTYLANEHRIRDGFMPGMRIMTFAQMLKYNTYPIAGVLKEILDFGRNGMGCEIEIEFAVNLEEKVKDSVFYLLQMRPMVTGGEDVDVEIDEDEISRSICYSNQCLGHGKFDAFSDVILVRKDTFDPAKTKDIAREISRLNGQLEKDGRHYVLIGPGRWGSADHWLGIPVQWSDISGVGAIIEVRSEQLRADPSQGSHFFQNITSLGIPYITVNDDSTRAQKSSEYIDWNWFDSVQSIEDTTFLRHIRMDKTFLLKCNGKESESVMIYPANVG
jgi:hypothetical protein